MHERAAAGHQKPANGQLCLNYLSHPRGQAQGAFSFMTLESAAPIPLWTSWGPIEPVVWVSVTSDRATIAT